MLPSFYGDEFAPVSTEKPGYLRGRSWLGNAPMPM
jgi:hypothetical protein